MLNKSLSNVACTCHAELIRGIVPIYEGACTALDFTDTYNDCILMTVQGVTKKDYETYIAKFASVDGYEEIVAPHEVLGDTGNIASMYTKDGKHLINLLWIPEKNSIYGTGELKVTAEPRHSTDLSVFAPTAATAGDFDTLLIQIGIDGVNAERDENGRFDANTCRCGMAYAYRLSDGRFVVFDGGGNDLGTSDMDKDCAARIYKTLKKYSPTENIVIACWYFTHPHIDHMGGFMAFVGKYLSDSAYRITLQNVISYMPNIKVQTYVEPEFEYSLSPEKVEVYNVQLEALRDAGVNVHKAHAGQVYYFGNLTLEILFTYDLITPKLPDAFFITDAYARMKAHGVIMNSAGHGRDFSNSFSVMSVATVKTDEETSYKAMWTGDATCFCIETVNAMYGPSMKCDFVQVPHHGGTQMRDGSESDEKVKYHHQIEVNAFFGAVADAKQKKTPIALFPEYYNPDSSYGYVRAQYVLFPSSINRVDFYDDIDNIKPDMDVYECDRSRLSTWSPLYHLQDEARLAGGDSYLARCYLTVFTLGKTVSVEKDCDVITPNMA